MHMSDLRSKVALVTGGGSGIGRASAVALARAGAKVVVSGRRLEALEETVRVIRAAGSDGLAVQADVTKAAEVERLIERVQQHFGRLDIAFNNAGTEGSPRPIVDATEAEYDAVFDANVRGVWLSMKYQIPALLAAGGGVIINNASVAGVVGLAAAPLYVASKHAVIGLTSSAALAYAKQGIRINAVSPGAIETEMFDRFTGGSADAKSWMANGHPVGRVGTADEIAGAVVFLASAESSFVTGHNLLVDGGYTVQ
jgi:NAD(P)-dependent dehydrogenase (short-subunit alcohol dehydrogenase family)